MQELVRGVREIRNRYILDKTPLDLSVKCNDVVAMELNALAPFVKLLGGLSSFTCGSATTKPKQSGSIIRGDFEAYVNLTGLIDVPAEIKRLEKQIAEKRKQLEGIQGKLANAGFLAKAPPEQVQESRDKASELQTQIELMETNLDELRAD